jgi:hypothetical protein
VVEKRKSADPEVRWPELDWILVDDPVALPRLLGGLDAFNIGLTIELANRIFKWLV